MPHIVLTSTLSNRFTEGVHRFDVSATNVRQLFRELEERYPGLGREIENAQALAIDGVIFQDPYLQSIAADAEVFVLPKLGGG